MTWLLLVGVGLVTVLLILTFVPFWLDPYYHKSYVDFWFWASRELNELLRGEKE